MQKELKIFWRNLNIYIVLLLGLVFLIIFNYLFSLVNWQLDWSNGRVYTLSESSQKLVKNLKGKVTGTLYLSSDLPVRLLPLKRDLLDILSEYQKLNPSKFELRIVDPTADIKVLQKAKNLNILPLRLSELNNDQLTVKTGYLAAVFNNQNQTQVLPALINPGSLEFEISSALYRLDSERIPTVGVINSEKSQILIEQLGKIFAVREVNLTNYRSYLLDALVFIGNNEPSLTDLEVKLLEEYLQTGKTLILLINNFYLDGQLNYWERNSGFDTLLNKWGIKLGRRLVLSTNSEETNYQSDNTNLVTKYPYWLSISKSEISPVLGFATNSTQLIFPWANTVKIENQAIKKDWLIKTPLQSWLTVDTPNLMPNVIQENIPDDFSPDLTLAVYAQKNNQQLIVFGSSYFLNDQFNKQNLNNIDFFSKLLNSSLSKGELSTIPSRADNYAPLKNDFSALDKQMLRLFAALFPGSIFCLWGWMRKRRIDKR